MADQEFIVDAGLFAERADFNFSLPESSETISTYLKTIKEYRDYAHPDSPLWEEYIHEFFQVLRFSTDRQAPRLIALKEIGSTAVPKAIVGILLPGENFEEIIPGLDWYSYLFYAAAYHKVEWGILTNGLELKVFHCDSRDASRPFFWCNLDGVITAERADSFFRLYRVLSYVCGRRGAAAKKGSERRGERAARSTASEFDLSDLTQGVPEPIVALFDALRPKILSLSSSVAERFNKLYVGYSAGRNFCEIIFQKRQLKIYLDVNVDELSDPQSLCKDVRGIGHHGTGDTEVSLFRVEDIDAVFDLIQRSYARNWR